MVGNSFAVGGQMPDADQPNRRAGVKRRDEVGEGAVDDLRVGVEEEDVARIAGHQRAVVPVGEAAVPLQTTRACRELALDQLSRAVGGVVVGDDDVERDVPRLGKDRGQARREPFALVGRDDDHRQVVGRGLR